MNNTIADNHGFGSGIFADGFDAETRLINNLVIGSEGETAVLCGTGYDPASTPMFEFNNVFSPLGAAYGGSCSDQTGISGNISADPLFVDPSNGDYHLQPGSPAIDAGDNTAPRLLQEQDLHLLRPDTDFDGDYRILDGDGDGVAVVDIGVDEFSPAPTPALTCGGLGATIVGTEGDDVITGTNGPDVIVGLGGNDVIDGRGGDDVICGGDGDDVLEGGPRNDVLDGGKGEDTLKGGPGTDDCDGSGGDDTAENCETVSNVP